MATPLRGFDIEFSVPQEDIEITVLHAFQTSLPHIEEYKFSFEHIYMVAFFRKVQFGVLTSRFTITHLTSIYASIPEMQNSPPQSVHQ